MFAFKSLILATVISYALALSSSLQPVNVNFGSNPTNVQMFVYKPTSLATPTPLIVAMHYCTGTAQAYFSGTSQHDDFHIHILLEILSTLLDVCVLRDCSQGG